VIADSLNVYEDMPMSQHLIRNHDRIVSIIQ